MKKQIEELDPTVNFLKEENEHLEDVRSITYLMARRVALSFSVTVGEFLNSKCN